MGLLNPRLLYVVTDPFSVRVLLAGQLRFMAEAGFHVGVVSAPGRGLENARLSERVETISVRMGREISVGRDLRSLAQLVRAFQYFRPHIVNASTPKAGLLSMLAATVTGVAVRIYTVRGLRFETAVGSKRKLLEASEKVCCLCADRVVCVSNSLRSMLVSRHLVQAEKTTVLGSGSSNGVDATRFDRNRCLLDRAEDNRRNLRIPTNVPVIGYVGRLTRDKGVVDLFHAFQRLLRNHSDARLLVVGGFEPGDPVPAEIRRQMEAHPQVILAGPCEDPAPLFALMTVYAFPSYREGFPNTVLEAAASQLPVAGYRATGTVDAVVEGTTGTLVSIGNIDALASAMHTYIRDPDTSKRHGLEGRRRAVRCFDQQMVWQSLGNEYMRLLRARSLPLPRGPV